MAHRRRLGGWIRGHSQRRASAHPKYAVFPSRCRVLDPLIDLPELTEACENLGFNPKITLIVVGKYHKVVFFPADPNNKFNADRNGNCLPGTVVDTDIVSPVEWDYYLCTHAGLLGTSRPAHYNVLFDENELTYVVSQLIRLKC